MADDFNKQQSRKIIVGKVNRVLASGAKLNASIHEVGLDIMAHAQTYGDASEGARLVEGLPSHRMNILVKWFAAYTPISIGLIPKDARKDGQPIMKAFLKGKPEDRVWNIEAAKATPFYALPEAQRPDPEMPTLDSIHNNVISFFGRMRKQADKIVNGDEKMAAIAELDEMERLANKVANHREVEADKAVTKIVAQGAGAEATAPRRQRRGKVAAAA